MVYMQFTLVPFSTPYGLLRDGQLTPALQFEYTVLHLGALALKCQPINLDLGGTLWLLKYHFGDPHTKTQFYKAEVYDLVVGSLPTLYT